MNLDLIELFADVAKLGSFAEVARRRDLDPSQVSRAIAQLEAKLNTPVLRRSTRSMALTEAGERYLQRVLPLIDELRMAEDEAREQSASPSGLLRVTASTAFGQICLLPHIGEFYQRYPEIQLDLILSDQNLDLLKDNIDVACRLSAHFDSDHQGTKLFDTHYHVVASPKYLERHPAVYQPQDLSLHDCLVFSMASYRSSWIFHSAGEQQVKIRSRMAVSNALALRALLLDGLGPGLVPSWLVEREISAGELTVLLPSWRVTATDFKTAAWLLYPSRKFLPLKTRVMLDFLKEKFAS
jgi:DNA-binding transcriptional LysR family regulator